MVAAPESFPSSPSPMGLRRFAAALRAIGQRQDVDETLQLAIDLAPELIHAVDAADIMFLRGGRVATPVATDALAVAVDRAQMDHGQGPCLSALFEQPTVVVQDLASETRWPDFAAEAVRLGVRSVAAFRLFVHRNGERSLGVLNLYSTGTGFDDFAVGLGGVLAAHCSSVLQSAMTNEGMHAALRSRDVIGQAKGILMERHRLTPDEAYDLLRRTSNERNVKVRDLAEDVARTGQLS